MTLGFVDGFYIEKTYKRAIQNETKRHNVKLKPLIIFGEMSTKTF